MRHYEAMYLVNVEVVDEALDAIIAKYSKVVTDNGGEVSEAAKWERGRRQLAYAIGTHKEATYLLMQFVANADVPKELDRQFRISDDVIRHLISRQDAREE